MVPCMICGDADRLSPITGMAGRYISIANGPIQESSPRIRAGRANEPDMKHLSRDEQES